MLLSRASQNDLPLTQMSVTPRIECQASLRKKPQYGDSLFLAPQLPGLSLALGEFRSNSRKPQLEVPWRVGRKGDAHGGPTSERRISWRAALRVPLHPALNCPTGGSAKEPAEPQEGLGQQRTRATVLLCTWGKGLCSLEVARRIPVPGSSLLSSEFLKLQRGSKPFAAEVEDAFALSQVFSEVPQGSTGPSSPA